jgi:hypothetical protein
MEFRNKGLRRQGFKVELGFAPALKICLLLVLVWLSHLRWFAVILGTTPL